MRLFEDIGAGHRYRRTGCIESADCGETPPNGFRQVASGGAFTEEWCVENPASLFAHRTTMVERVRKRSLVTSSSPRMVMLPICPCYIGSSYGPQICITS